MSSDAKDPLLGSTSSGPTQSPIFFGRTMSFESKNMKYFLIGFLGFVVFNIILSTVMVSVQAKKENALFVLLLISLLSFAQVEIFMVFFIYRGYLPENYFWVIFLVGVFVIIEAISTDIIVFTIK